MIRLMSFISMKVEQLEISQSWYKIIPILETFFIPD